MDSNIYKPPEAKLVIEQNQQHLHKFYIVSPKKFLILYFATIGLYEVYWFYRNWQAYKKATQHKLIPIVRAIFYFVFTFALFNKIHADLQEKKKSSIGIT